MEYLIYVLIAVFAICLILGLGALHFYNLFSRLRVKIHEAEESIALFQSQRTGSVEALQPLAEKLGTSLNKDIHRILELNRASKPESGNPGHAGGSTELEALMGNLKRELRKEDLSAQFSVVLDQMERAEIELNGSRRYYNALVREHNILVTGFPSAVVAFLFRFKEIDYLKTMEGDER